MANFSFDEFKVYSSSKEKPFHVGIPKITSAKVTDFFFERMNAELEYLVKQIFLYSQRSSIELASLRYYFGYTYLEQLLPVDYEQDIKNGFLYINKPSYNILREAVIETYKRAIKEFFFVFLKNLYIFERYKPEIKQQILRLGLTEPFSIIKKIDCITINPNTLFKNRINVDIILKMENIITIEQYNSAFKMGGISQRALSRELSKSIYSLDLNTTIM